MNTKLRCVAGPSLIYIQHQLYFPNKNVLVPGIWYDVFGAFCKIWSPNEQYYSSTLEIQAGP
jgi:hypothetical protein